MDLRDAMIMLLAIAGGGVDAVVFLGFGVLTAAQTGNTILLAVAVAQGRFAVGFHSMISIAGYVAGTAIGELLILRRLETARKPSTPWITPARWALIAEVIVLGGVLAAWRLLGPSPSTATSTIPIAVTAVAMGIQSAAVLRLHAGPATTYVTGTLTWFTTKAIRWVRLLETAPPTGRREHAARGGALSGDRPWIYGITWLVYAVGAFSSGLLFQRAGGIALLLPLIVIVATIGVSFGARRAKNAYAPAEPR